ncbi:MAG: hypothetical protein NT062_03470 [Proteobacteria bacterium]|nr:hypothetical protein [Pseudomonadota bacterium]
MGLSACGAQLGGGNGLPDATVDGPTTLDDGAPGDAAMLGAWGAPVPITAANTPGVSEDDVSLSWSGTELIFARVDTTVKHLYISTLVGGAWSTPVKAPFSAPDANRDESPRFAPNDLTLYFASTRAPTDGGSDIWMVTRPTTTSPWSATPTRITALSGTTTEKWVTACGGNNFLMARVSANGETEIYTGANLATPTKVAELDSMTVGANESGTFLTPDCLTTYFASSRDGTNDLWTSQRTTLGAPWAAPTKVTTFGTANNEQDPWMSADGRTFVFASDISGDNDLYMSKR